MKIRTGFVSNSSSTSFCVFGRYYSLDEKYTDIDNIKEKIEAAANKCNLECVMTYDADCIVVGAPVEDLEGKDTFDDFKERAIKQMREFEKKCKWLDKEKFKDLGSYNWQYGEITGDGL
jgi:hypothetical protein